MTTNILNFAIFWGIWLLVPIVIDGLTSLLYLVGVWRAASIARRQKSRLPERFFPPFVTVIVPVYNGQDSIGKCLDSIRRQSYPHDCLQVIVVNNRSTDQSFQAFATEQAKPFAGPMTWVDTTQKGKVWALNAGIHLAHGTIIINVDCDTMLRPDAIMNMARAFESDPQLAAATGAIEVLPVDRSSQPPWKAIWAECEALEYLGAFLIGRQYQSATNSLFTLAGAFSAFRREIILDTFLYDQATVSEDTKMTLDIRQRSIDANMRIGCVADAIAYVEPTLSVSKMYAQRVRWQRGELEVAALQPNLRAREMLRLKGLSISRMLIVDHTLAFPRLVWTFLMPMLYFFGYPLPLVVSASIGMYFFYALIDTLLMGTCYVLSTADIRTRLRDYWFLPLVMPAYRFILFWFRFGGFLNVLTDEAQWRVTDPWEETRAGLRTLGKSIRMLWQRPT